MNPDSDLIGLHFILAGAGILLTLLGLFLVIANWYSITEWVLTIRRNPRYNRGDASIPLLGGLILCVGILFLHAGFGPSIPLWSAALGLIIDYGCLPGMILSPLLYRWSEQRKNAAKRTKKFAPPRKKNAPEPVSRSRARILTPLERSKQNPD